MHPNEELIESFYSSFQKLDAEGMARCYHEDIEFSDPAFPALKGTEASAMWSMLCSQAKGFELSFDQIQADDQSGRAHWEAKYTFSTTGRKVHNKIDAHFEFKDGKIIRHTDSFNFWKWTRMALGPVGILLGWSPIVRNQVRAQAAKSLKRFIEKSKS